MAARDHRDHQDHRDGLDLAPLERGIDGTRDSCRLGSGPARRAFRACPAALSGRPRWWAGRETRDARREGGHLSHVFWSHVSARVSRLTSHDLPSRPPGPPRGQVARLGPPAPSRLSWWSRWSRSGSGGEAKCARVATKSAAAKHMSGAPLPLPLSGGSSRVAARDHRDHQDHRDGLDLAPLERGIDGTRDSCRLGSGPARRAFRACPAALSGRPRWWAGRET